MNTLFPQVPKVEIVAHIKETNPHVEYTRNAFYQIPFDRYDWYGPMALNVNDPRFGEVKAASARDVRRYQQLPTPFPAIIVSLEPGHRLAIQDGAHRLLAARAREATTLPGFVGLPKGADPGVLAAISAL